MLRVGLTGGLGSGKSTVATIFAALGAEVVSADELGRQMMQPGQRVFDAIVAHFGTEVLTSTGALDRTLLARLSFAEGRVAELNAIVHPAVIDRQTALAADLARRKPEAVFLVESALLFETEHAGAGGWRARFDRILLVTASEETKVARFVARGATTSAGESADRAADARGRLARQISDAEKARLADFVLTNDGSLPQLQQQVEQLWPRLKTEARSPAPSGRAH